jgi:hypothetical protein
VLLLASCGSDALAPDVACNDFVNALCSQLQNCGAPLVKITYGDEATCELRLKPSCLSTLKDPGTTLTTDRLDSCAKQLMAQTCTAIFNHVVPDACKPTAGSLADGTACGDDNQCKSAYCKKAASSTCGVCGAKSSSCVVDGDCDSASVCAANGTCVQRGAMGAACSANMPCAYGLSCDNLACATAPGAGQACKADLMGGNCDKTQGLFCTAGMVCQAAGYANAGQPCGFTGGNIVLCTAGSKCSATGLQAGTCIAPAADGAACNDTNGPTCEAPASCQNSVCTVADTSTCK